MVAELLIHLAVEFSGIEDFWWFWPGVGAFLLGFWLLGKWFGVELVESPYRPSSRILDLRE